MLIIGHRGAADLAPENTLKSVQTALDSGVDMIEIDISLCKTGEVVVMHDERVDKRTNGKGYIRDYTLKDLKKLDAGEGEKIPTLLEVINLIDGRCPLNIEIKGRGSSAEVARILKEEVGEKRRTTDDFCISSFDHFELARFKQYCPDVRISPLISCLPLGLASLAEEMGAWSLNMKKEFINGEIVQDAHRRGLKVLVFTVDRPDERLELERLGVDGIFTNNRYRVLGLNPPKG